MNLNGESSSTARQEGPLDLIAFLKCCQRTCLPFPSALCVGDKLENPTCCCSPRRHSLDVTLLHNTKLILKHIHTFTYTGNKKGQNDASTLSIIHYCNFQSFYWTFLSVLRSTTVLPCCARGIFFRVSSLPLNCKQALSHIPVTTTKM